VWQICYQFDLEAFDITVGVTLQIPGDFTKCVKAEIQAYKFSVLHNQM